MSLRLSLVGGLLLTGLLVCVVVLSQSRSNASAGALRFMPADAEAVLTAPSIEAAWRLLEPHVRRIDRGTPCGDKNETRLQTLRSALMSARCSLRGPAEAPLQSLAGLRSIGIDTSGSVAVSFSRRGRDGNPSIVAAVPVRDKSRLAVWLARRGEEKPSIPQCGKAPHGEDFCFAMQDGSYALVMSHDLWPRMQRPVHEGSDWHADDTIAELLHGAAGGQSDADSRVAILISVPTPIAGVLSGDAFRLRFRARAKFGPQVSNTMRSFLDPIDRSDGGRLTGKLPLAATLAGENLGARLEYVQAFAPQILDRINSLLVQRSYSFQPILPAIAKSKSVSALTFGVVDFDHSVPRLAIVAKEREKQSDELVRKLQLSNAQRRFDALHDRISGCIKLSVPSDDDASIPVCRRAEARAEPSAPTISPIDGLTIHSPQPEGLPRMSSTTIEKEHARRRAEKELTRNDPDELLFAGRVPLFPEPAFDGPSYSGCLEPQPECPEDRRYRFIAPAYNANDFKWLLEAPSADEENRLRRNAYRLVSFYERDQALLWLALDLTTLRAALAAAQANGSAQSNAAIQLHADPKFLWAQSLHNERSLDRIARELAADFRTYRSLEVTVTPLGESAGVLAEVSLDY